MAISDAESQVMEVLWKRSPRTMEEIAAALSDSQEWQSGTIKALLNRLLNKGAVTAEKDGRRYLYSPVLQRDAWVSVQSENLLDRLFGGRLAPLVAHFSEQRKLSKRDIADIKRLLEQLDHD